MQVCTKGFYSYMGLRFEVTLENTFIRFVKY